MISKIVQSHAEAAFGNADGPTLLVGGFGTAGMPFRLVDALYCTGFAAIEIVPGLPFEDLQELTGGTPVDACRRKVV